MVCPMGAGTRRGGVARHKMGLIAAPDSGKDAISEIVRTTLHSNVRGGVFPEVNWVRPPLIETRLANNPIPRFQWKPQFP